jgi:hypothetical protein
LKKAAASCSACVGGRWTRGRVGTLLCHVAPCWFEVEDASVGPLGPVGALAEDGAEGAVGAVGAEGALGADGALGAEGAEAAVGVLARAASNPIRAGAAYAAPATRPRRANAARRVSFASVMVVSFVL